MPEGRPRCVVASCVLLWGLQRAVAPTRSAGGPGCWLEELPQSRSWQAGWESWDSPGWQCWSRHPLLGSVFQLGLPCRVSLRVTAWWFAGGCRGLPWCPQALCCHPSWPWPWGTSTQDKTQVTTAVMLPLRRPDGGQSQPSTAMRTSPGQGQHHVVSDLGHPPSSDTSG